MLYTIYKKSTGLICGTGSSPVDNLSDIAINNDEGIVEGNYDQKKYKIVSGSAVTFVPSLFPALRRKRNFLLQESDWTQLPDCGLSNSKKTEWQTYRQNLRDLPASYNEGDLLENVVYPTDPTL